MQKPMISEERYLEIKKMARNYSSSFDYTLSPMDKSRAASSLARKHNLTGEDVIIFQTSLLMPDNEKMEEIFNKTQGLLTAEETRNISDELGVTRTDLSYKLLEMQALPSLYQQALDLYKTYIPKEVSLSEEVHTEVGDKVETINASLERLDRMAGLNDRLPSFEPVRRAIERSKISSEEHQLQAQISILNNEREAMELSIEGKKRVLANLENQISVLNSKLQSTQARLRSLSELDNEVSGMANQLADYVDAKLNGKNVK